MSAPARRPFSREQRLTIIQGMLIFVLIVVVLQLWLLTATMNAWLGGDESLVGSAAAASAGSSASPSPVMGGTLSSNAIAPTPPPGSRRTISWSAISSA